jgi:hypothetical protein
MPLLPCKVVVLPAEPASPSRAEDRARSTATHAIIIGSHRFDVDLLPPVSEQRKLELLVSAWVTHLHDLQNSAFAHTDRHLQGYEQKQMYARLWRTGTTGSQLNKSFLTVVAGYCYLVPYEVKSSAIILLRGL